MDSNTAPQCHILICEMFIVIIFFAAAPHHSQWPDLNVTRRRLDSSTLVQLFQNFWMLFWMKQFKVWDTRRKQIADAIFCIF